MWSQSQVQAQAMSLLALGYQVLTTLLWVRLALQPHHPVSFTLVLTAQALTPQSLRLLLRLL
jgi:hypothetical protein